MSGGTKFLVGLLVIVALAAGTAAFMRSFPGKGEQVEQIPANPSATSYATP